MIQRLSIKNFWDIIDLVKECKDFSNFYITKENIRIPLKDLQLIKQVLLNCTKYDDMAFGYFKESELIAVVIIIGNREKKRPYIKILSKERNFYIIDSLVRGLFWNYGKNEVFAKINKTDTFLEKILKKNQFVFRGLRGLEILLKRDRIKIKTLDMERTNG